MHTRSWLTFHSVLATKRIWRKAPKRRMEAQKVGTYSFDRISTKTLLRFVAFVLRRENRTTIGTAASIFPLIFLPLPSVPFCFQRGIATSSLCTSIVGTTRARKLHGFPFLLAGEGKRLPASLVISCRLAIAGFRSLSPGSLGVISGKLFRGSSWSTFG